MPGDEEFLRQFMEDRQATLTAMYGPRGERNLLTEEVIEFFMVQLATTNLMIAKMLTHPDPTELL